MPGAYTIDSVRGVVLTRAWARLTGAELLAHARALRADPRFRPHFKQLADLTAVSDLAVHAAGIRAVAAENPFGATSRRAFVVGSDVAFGMARMYQLLTDDSPDELYVFREMQAALEWLGLGASADELLAALNSAPDFAIPS